MMQTIVSRLIPDKPSDNIIFGAWKSTAQPDAGVDSKNPQNFHKQDSNQTIVKETILPYYLAIA